MYTRFLSIQKNSILLLGPRGTGKSTWIEFTYPDAIRYDLLDTELFLKLSQTPSLLYDEVHHLPAGAWVVIDEVQKIPALLDEVHRLIENHKIRFVLSGSSARKLKRTGVNLLAGRAEWIHFFPLVLHEMNYSIDIHQLLRFGSLPMSVSHKDPTRFLSTYSQTYLKEEIKDEALTRNIGNFSRFLEIAARQNAQVTSTTNISNDAKVARTTVDEYFSILVDTLIGFWLPAWKLKTSNRHVQSPKFYFFDTGVVRALSQRLSYPPSPEEMGFLLETYLLHEIRTYLSYTNKMYPLYFWKTYSGTEVDLMLEDQRGYVAIDIKSGTEWRPSFMKGFYQLQTELPYKKLRCFGVFMGDRKLVVNNIPVYPVLDFIKMLWSGEIII